MTTDAREKIPDLAEVLLPILARVPEEHQPLLIALAERRAARRYRGWADEPDYASHGADLLACAEREEEIARRVEALFGDSEEVQTAIQAANPDIDAITNGIFAKLSLPTQFATQARGERLGAATWRSFARKSDDAAARETYLACALLEEESAAVLESILQDAISPESRDQ